MSRKNSPQRQLHLIFTEDAGFQFYYTLPTHFSQHPELPKQLRWSLGREEALARQLCSYLDNALNTLAQTPFKHTRTEINEAVRVFDLLHKTVRIQLEHAQMIWKRLPHPSALAKADLSEGRQRLDELQSQDMVLYRKSAGGELIFSLQPREGLKKTARKDKMVQTIFEITA